MRLLCVAALVSLLSGCAQRSLHQRELAPVGPIYFSSVWWDNSNPVQLTLHVDRPGFVYLIEQTPDGLLSLLSPDSLSAPGRDSGAYRFDVPLYFSHNPPPIPPPPAAPCSDYVPTDRGMTQKSTGFCGLSQNLGVAARRFMSFPSFLPFSDAHRVIAVELSRSIPRSAIDTVLDSLPVEVTPHQLARAMSARIEPDTAAILWAVVGIPAKRP